MHLVTLIGVAPERLDGGRMQRYEPGPPELRFSDGHYSSVEIHIVSTQAERFAASHASQLPRVGAHVLGSNFPAGPYRPRDKAAAEVGVQVAERWILAPLGKRQFFSLAELNAAIAEQLRLVNARRFRGQPISRRDLFEELERAALQPLPIARYEFATWKPARVNIDYHVEFETRYYSVPYELARQAVRCVPRPT